MADNLADRMTELSEIYGNILTSHGTFGHFLRSKLTKDVFEKV